MSCCLIDILLHLFSPKSKSKPDPNRSAIEADDHQPEPSDSTPPTMAQHSNPAPHHSPATARASQPLQFFVRPISGETLVLRANSSDTVLSLLTLIALKTRIPPHHHRLLHRGRQLEHDRTLGDYSIQNDSELQLVGRLRSAWCSKIWGVVDDILSSVRRLLKGECLQRHKDDAESNICAFLGLTFEYPVEVYEIFIDAGAATALVLLFFSGFAGNKECAMDLIRRLLAPDIDKYPKWTKFNCIPIIIEFCKLLRGKDKEDLLYSACRTTLGSLLNSVGFECGYFAFAKHRAVIQDLFPFVRELATAVIADLKSIFHAEGRKYKENVCDFIAFLRPLRRTIEYHVDMTSEDAIGMGHTCCTDEVKAMFDLLWELLNKINQALVQVENILSSEGADSESETSLNNWDQYIPIMKELNSMGSFYKTLKVVLHSIMRDRRISINHLIKHLKQNPERDNHHWLFEFRDVMDFESKRHLVFLMFPVMQYKYGEMHEMLIGRSNLLHDSFAYISSADHKSFRNGLLVAFKDEKATGAGVLREWFYLVCQEIFDPRNPLFLACPNDRRRFYPNPASKVEGQHLNYFMFCGRVIALALMNKVHIGVVFDRVFFLQLAGKSVSLEDVRDADPYLYMSCKKILEMDAEFVDSDSLGLTFAREIEELGSRMVVDLKNGGKDIVVNSENREEYVNLLIQHRFVTSISEQVDHFAQGFGDILEDSKNRSLFFRSLELEDFDRMLRGNDNAICVKEWKAHTDYKGYKETDPQICWFWKVIEGISTEQQRSLLFFWTSVRYLPVTGFGGLASRLQISKASRATNHFPSSQTCFYKLCLPPYSSLAEMQKSIDFITQEHISRSFGSV